jgi:shikimate dehydrogenase
MGHPVSQSRSPLIHGYWLKQLGIAGDYVLKDVTPEDFESFFRNLPQHGFVGGNITIPHKEAAFRLVDHRETAAEAIGAVNTVWLEGPRLIGGNSDAHGFIANLDDSAPGWDVKDGHAVILGAGGAARAVAYGLIARGMQVTFVNRTFERAVNLAQKFGHGAVAAHWNEVPPLLARADLLVNCTSLGMIGKDPLEIDLAPLPQRAVVADVVYVPLETALLKAAKARGQRTADGLGMLLQQAGYGFQRWFGAAPTVTPELRAIIEADIRAKTPGS